MAREIVHKKLKLGTLIRFNDSNDIGIVVSACLNQNGFDNLNHVFSYGVYVRGKEVSANKEVFTVIGDI